MIACGRRAAPRCGIVIPAYNEETSIASMVGRICAYGTVIVVSDASSDATDERALAAGALVVRHPTNRGYDAALRTGFAKACDLGLAYVISCDADGQHDPRVVPRFFKALDAGCWVATGVRDQRPRLAESLFAMFTAWRWGIRDPMCGMKAYRTEIFKAMGHCGSYASVGSEALLFAARQRLPIAQLPIPIHQRDHGVSRFGATWKAEKRIIVAALAALTTRPAVAIRGRAESLRSCSPLVIKRQHLCKSTPGVHHAER